MEVKNGKNREVLRCKGSRLTFLFLSMKIRPLEVVGIRAIDKWERLKTDLYSKFNACTFGPIHKGVYQDPDTGEPVEDESYLIIVALEKDRIPELREYLKKVVAPIFRQKVIYFYNGREVEFIKGAKIQK